MTKRTEYYLLKIINDNGEHDAYLQREESGWAVVGSDPLDPEFHEADSALTLDLVNKGRRAFVRHKKNGWIEFTATLQVVKVTIEKKEEIV